MKASEAIIGSPPAAAANAAEADGPPCLVEEMFEALEQALPMFRRRRQATLFKQVKGVVEGMCHRSFTRQHLARIVYVYPGVIVECIYGRGR